MRVGRIMGWLLLALALVVAGGDVLASIEASELRLKPLGEILFAIAPAALNTAQAVVQRYLHPAIWDPGIVAILQLPGLVVLGLPALAAIYYFSRARHGRRRIFF